MSIAVAVALFAIALGAFATEATLGFGATVLSVSLGAQLVSLDRFLPAFVPVNAILSISILVKYRRQVAWRVLLTEVAPVMAAGAAVGLMLFRIPARQVLELVFGLSVMALAVVELARFGAAAVPEDAEPMPPPPPRRRALPFLLLGGVAHGLFGTGGPMVVYVLRRRLPDKTVFRATLAALWITMNGALLANYASLHLFGPATLRLSVVLAAAVGPGFLVGEHLHHRVPARTFHRVVLVVLLAAGAVLAVRTAVSLAG